ncbi:hypothetical protein GALMADRAFT_246215 [Galerina marginata CBS 339.88]|uniref:Uncharacterized protein n=1 Tax=Galerina marginata (strain CBS 339.88) TaxID=685588 RepID=A0A067TDH6_GALM3|nr:hypothetical protein GALMADRAFT_246215 [Galerina marginata CBS 339.88]
MFFKLSTLFVALAAITAATSSAIPEKRQTNSPIATCYYFLKPDVTVTPTVAEFNYVIGQALSADAGSPVVNAFTSFEADGDRFGVVNRISAEGKTAAETTDIIRGWSGETKAGLLANWLVDSVACL